MPETRTRDRLIEVTLDDTGLAPPTPEVEQERRVAIFDLLEDNRFALPPRDGPPCAARAPTSCASASASGAWSSRWWRRPARRRASSTFRSPPSTRW